MIRNVLLGTIILCLFGCFYENSNAHSHSEELPNAGVYEFQSYKTKINCDLVEEDCIFNEVDSVDVKVLLYINGDDKFSKEVYADSSLISYESGNLVHTGYNVAFLKDSITSFSIQNFENGNIILGDELLNVDNNRSYEPIYNNYSISIDLVSITENCFSYHEATLPEDHDYAEVIEVCLI